MSSRPAAAGEPGPAPLPRRRALFDGALLGLALLLGPATALAYIDPGTTGLVLGGLGGALAYGAVALVVVRKRLVQLFKWCLRLITRHPIPAAVLALVLAGGAAGGWAMLQRSGGPDTVNPIALKADRFDRVLALGVDGADPKLVKSLMDQGLLPNLQRLADAGGLRPLAIPNPAQSPVVWASLATGQNPGRTGVFDFIGRDPARYLPQLSLLARTGNGTDYVHPIHAKAFWDVTTEHGVPATILRWPTTFPPKKINGKMLSGLGVPDVRGSLGRYTWFSDVAPEQGSDGSEKVTLVKFEGGEARAELGGPQVRGLSGVKTLSVPVKIRTDPESRVAIVTVGKQSFSLAEGDYSDWVELTFEAGLFTKHRGLAKLYLASAAKPFGLLVTSVEMHPEAPIVGFTSPKEYAGELRKEIGLYHTLGMPEDTKAYGEGRMTEAAFLQMCRDVDAERQAMLLAELGRFDKGVLAVVFDTLDRIGHMTPAGQPATSASGRYLIDFDRFLGKVLDKLEADTPVLVFSDHGFSEFDKAVDLNRWLVENGEMAIDEEGWKARPAGSHGELFRHVKWEGTQAYAVGFAGIYVNLQGREGKGTVEPAERAAVAARVAERLAGLTDPDTGERVVERVYRREEIYRGAHVEQAPDLVVGFRPGYRASWQSAVGGLAETTLAPNDKLWQRDHIVDPSFVPGTLVTNVPILTDRPHAYDLAPTILELLGLPVPDEMEGRPFNRAPNLASSADPAAVQAAKESELEHVD